MTSQIDLPPLPISINSPVDLNRCALQYAQQDRGNNWYVCTQTPRTLTAGPATTGFGLALFSYTAAPNLEKNLVIRSIQIALTVAPVVPVNFFYCINANGASGYTTIAQGSGFNPVCAQQGLNNGIVSNALAFVGGTLSGSPVIVRQSINVLASNTAKVSTRDAINGQIVVPPGECLSIQASSAVTGYFAIVWDEQFLW